MLYQISSGQGPAECELGVAKFLEYLKRNFQVTVTDASPGYNEGTYRSVRFYSENDLSEYVGSIQWVCQSPYRPAHRRKNWFLDFSVLPVTSGEEFRPDQVMFETFRSGGPGGQNVNKVESGVRAIYLPTGQAVVCTEERSQYANKQKALSRLARTVEEENRQREAEDKNGAWRRHTRIERGNAKLVFRGVSFIPDSSLWK